MIEWIVGGAVAGGTYLYAKKKKQASTGQSATAAAATGAASFGATWLTIAAVTAVWPVLVLGAIAGGYFIGRKRPKALPPAPDET
jgi:hypothetical protein